MYLDYFNAIRTLIESSVPTIGTVDYYNEQYDRYEDLNQKKLPAVYVEFENPMSWEDEGNGVQNCETNIALHVVVKDLAESPEKGLITAQQVHLAIHGKRLMANDKQISTELMRNASALETPFDQIKVVVLQYKTRLFDYSAVKELVEVQVSPKVERISTYI